MVGIAQSQNREWLKLSDDVRTDCSPGAGTPNFFFVQPADYLESELTEW